MTSSTTTATTTATTIYTEVRGTNCTIDGRRGIVTGFTYGPGLTSPELRFAFVKLDSGEMLHVQLGRATGDRGAHHEVTGSRVIDRAEFDRLNGIDEIRTALGWR